MQKVDVDDLDDGEATRWSMSDPLEASDFSLNYYALDPGEEFSGGLHTHGDQEEAFYVLEGEAVFETSPTPSAESETVTVGEGEMVRFAPGEYQQGRNESDDPLRALALGAPQESTDVRVAAPCRECGESDYLQYVHVDGETKLRCPECGTELQV